MRDSFGTGTGSNFKRAQQPVTEENVHALVTCYARGDQAAAQEEEVINTRFVIHVYDTESKNCGESMRNAKRKDWKIAMHEELVALESNDVWRLLNRLFDCN